MTLHEIKNNEVWDNFVDSSPYGMIFHKSDFLNIIQKHSGFQLKKFGFFKGNELLGVLPVFTKKFISKNLIFSPPPGSGVPYLGMVVSKNYDKLKENKKISLVKTISDDIKKDLTNSCMYYSIQNPLYLTDTRPFLWNGFDVNVHYTYVLDLNNGIGDIKINLHRHLRNELNKIPEKNLYFKKSDDVNFFYDDLKKRYDAQKIKLPLYSKEYVGEIISKFPEYLDLIYLYDLNDNVLGSILMNKYKRYIVWMGITKSDSSSFVNNYLIWKMIEEACNNNMKLFEINGARNENLAFFKSRFNPDLVISYSLVKTTNFGRVMRYAYKTIFK